MKLSQMVNKQSENTAHKAAEKQEASIVNPSTLSPEDKAEFEALINVGIPRIDATTKIAQSVIDDVTKAEIAELKSFAGM